MELLRSAVREQKLQRASPVGTVRLLGFRPVLRSIAHAVRGNALNSLPPAPFTLSKGGRRLYNDPWLGVRCQRCARARPAIS